MRAGGAWRKAAKFKKPLSLCLEILVAKFYR